MANKWNLEGISADMQNNLKVEAVVGLKTYTFATLPAVVVGGIIYVSNGAGGDPILAFGAGEAWLRSDTRAECAAS